MTSNIDPQYPAAGTALTANVRTNFQHAKDEIDALQALTIFKTIDCPAGTNPVADTDSDTLTLAAGSNKITITGTSSSDTVTFDVATSNININDLGDVNAGSPTNNQSLTWDTGSSKWVPETVSAGSAGGWTDDGGVVRLTTIGDEVGVGTVTVPHAGIGWAKLALEGTKRSADGPHVQFTIPDDDYPLMQMIMYDHDVVGIAFDAYYDGDWKSSDAGSNTMIYKVFDKLEFRYDSGVAAGSDLTWNVGFSMDLTDGHIQLRQAPTSYNPYDSATLDALVLRIAGGDTDNLISTRTPIIRVEKWSDADTGGGGAEHDVGAGMFSLIKQDGTADGNALTTYAEFKGGTVPGGLISLHARAYKTVSGNLYAGWFYAQGTNTGGFLHGIEVDVVTPSDTGHMTSIASGMSNGMWVVAGIDSGDDATWGIGIHGGGTGKWHTGIFINLNSIVPIDGGVNEAILIRGGSSAGNGYGGMMLTDYFDYGFHCSNAVIAGEDAIRIGSTHRVMWGNDDRYLYRSGNDLWWFDGTSGKKIQTI